MPARAYDEIERQMIADVGAILRQLRIAAGLSVYEAARRSRLSRGTIDSLERGKSAPSFPRALRLARTYGVTLAELGGKLDALYEYEPQTCGLKKPQACRGCGERGHNILRCEKKLAMCTPDEGERGRRVG